MKRRDNIERIKEKMEELLKTPKKVKVKKTSTKDSEKSKKKKIVKKED